MRSWYPVSVPDEVVNELTVLPIVNLKSLIGNSLSPMRIHGRSDKCWRAEDVECRLVSVPDEDSRPF